MILVKKAFRETKSTVELTINRLPGKARQVKPTQPRREQPNPAKFIEEVKSDEFEQTLTKINYTLIFVPHAHTYSLQLAFKI